MSHFIFAFLISVNAFAIVNGEKITRMDDPIARTSVAITAKSIKGQNTNCTAIVIRQDVLLTNAHCFEPSEFSVRLGLLIQRKDTSEAQAIAVAIEKVYENTQYNPNDAIDKRSREDIRMIQLTKPLPENYIPAEIDLDGLSNDQNITISGYGAQGLRTRKNAFSMAGIGTDENVELIKKNAKIANQDEQILKIESQNGGACQGDSGGGVYETASLTDSRNPKIIAINVAQDNQGGACGSVSFALRLASKKDWIRQQLALIDTTH